MADEQNPIEAAYEEWAHGVFVSPQPRLIFEAGWLARGRYTQKPVKDLNRKRHIAVDGLIKYGTHDSDCDIHRPEESLTAGECTCGLNKTLESLSLRPKLRNGRFS